MSFELNRTVNASKVFIASRFELRDRYDPEMVLFRRKAHEFKYPASRLRSLFSGAPQYGAGERGLERETEDEPRYIRITDIDEYGILTDGLGATAAQVEPQYVLEENDLLIARSGNTVGKAYIHKKQHAAKTCFFAGYLIRFRFRSEEVLADYVFAFTQLPYYKEWVQAVQRAAGQPNINAQEYSELEIPTPPLSIQKKVVELLHTAYLAKRRRDDEARKILCNIDDLLLAEIGIKRKPALPDALESRIFTRTLSSITGERFDPNYHRTDFQELSELLKEAPHARVREVVQFSSEQWDQNSLFQVNFPYIEIGSVDLAFGTLSDPIPTPITEAANRAKMIVRSGDLLVSLTRPTRRAICFAPDVFEIAIGSNGFAILRGVKNPNLHLRYLFHVLRSSVCVAQFEQRSSGGNYPAINEEQFSKMIIPLPPPDTQLRVVGLLDLQYSKAKNLLAQANDDLEKAKRVIEALILKQEGAE